MRLNKQPIQFVSGKTLFPKHYVYVLLNGFAYCRIVFTGRVFPVQEVLCSCAAQKFQGGGQGG